MAEIKEKAVQAPKILLSTEREESRMASVKVKILRVYQTQTESLPSHKTANGAISLSENIDKAASYFLIPSTKV